MSEKLYYIYKITNIVNNKIYIGFTENPKRRKEHHFLDHSKKTKKTKLQRAMLKYGREFFTFEIVFVSKDKTYTLQIIEPRLIVEFDSLSNGYNSNAGGGGGNSFPSAEKLRFLSDRMKGDNNPMKILRRNKGSFKPGHIPVITAERNKKVSLSKIGNKNPNFGISETAERINKKSQCDVCGTISNLGNLKRWHTNCQRVHNLLTIVH